LQIKLCFARWDTGAIGRKGRQLECFGQFDLNELNISLKLTDTWQPSTCPGQGIPAKGSRRLALAAVSPGTGRRTELDVADIRPGGANQPHALYTVQEIAYWRKTDVVKRLAELDPQGSFVTNLSRYKFII
jgi:hypothetical protein